MAQLADFLLHLLPLVPGCPTPLAEAIVRAVAIDFCTYAPVVQERLDPVDLVAGQAQYDIDLPYGVNVTLVIEATYHGREMQVLRGRDDQRERLTAPYALRQAADNTILLLPTPTQDEPGALHLCVATRPAGMASTVDDLLLLDYGYEIGCGAAARLFFMPGQSYSNPQLAPAYQTIYTMARTTARIRAEAGFGNGGMRVRPRAFI